MAEYDAWAEYYDLIHQGLPGEAEFYVGQAARLRGKTLEIGCGTGRIAIPMAMSGAHVIGLDVSKPMLDVCVEKLEMVGPVPGSLRLLVADMRAFHLEQQFDYIAMPYRTFMHCLTQEEQWDCLACVREHLADGGVFMLNVWAARPSQIAPYLGAGAGVQRLAGRYPLPDSDLQLLHFCGPRYNEFTQQLAEDHVVHIVDGQGVVKSSQHLTLTRAWLTMREMDNLVRACGFRVAALFGDFECAPFTEYSTEMIWVLETR